MRCKAFKVVPLSKREIFDSVLKFKRDDRAIGKLQFQCMKLIKCFRCGGVEDRAHQCPAILCTHCFCAGHEDCDRETLLRCPHCGLGGHDPAQCLDRPALECLPPDIRCLRCGQSGHIDCRL